MVNFPFKVVKAVLASSVHFSFEGLPFRGDVNGAETMI